MEKEAIKKKIEKLPPVIVEEIFRKHRRSSEIEAKREYLLKQIENTGFNWENIFKLYT